MTERRIPRIATAFSLGILSHIVLDAIPHGDYRPLAPTTTAWIAACEIVGVCLLAVYLLRRRLLPVWPVYLLPGLAGAVILDAKFFARILLSTNVARSVEHYGDYVHSFFHARPVSRPSTGWAIEIVCTIILLTTLTFFPRRDLH